MNNKVSDVSVFLVFFFFLLVNNVSTSNLQTFDRPFSSPISDMGSYYYSGTLAQRYSDYDATTVEYMPDWEYPRRSSTPFYAELTRSPTPTNVRALIDNFNADGLTQPENPEAQDNIPPFPSLTNMLSLYDTMLKKYIDYQCKNH